jgi:hypothetical protein
MLFGGVVFFQAEVRRLKGEAGKAFMDRVGFVEAFQNTEFSVRF